MYKRNPSRTSLQLKEGLFDANEKEKAFKSENETCFCLGWVLLAIKFAETSSSDAKGIQLISVPEGVVGPNRAGNEPFIKVFWEL